MPNTRKKWAALVAALSCWPLFTGVSMIADKDVGWVLAILGCVGLVVAVWLWRSARPERTRGENVIERAGPSAAASLATVSNEIAEEGHPQKAKLAGNFLATALSAVAIGSAVWFVIDLTGREEPIDEHLPAGQSIDEQSTEPGYVEKQATGLRSAEELQGGKSVPEAEMNREQNSPKEAVSLAVTAAADTERDLRTRPVCIDENLLPTDPVECPQLNATVERCGRSTAFSYGLTHPVRANSHMGMAAWHFRGCLQSGGLSWETCDKNEKGCYLFEYTGEKGFRDMRDFEGR